MSSVKERCRDVVASFGFLPADDEMLAPPASGMVLVIGSVIQGTVFGLATYVLGNATTMASVFSGVALASIILPVTFWTRPQAQEPEPPGK